MLSYILQVLLYTHVRVCIYTNDEGNINPTFIYMKRTNIKHIVFEFHTYIMCVVYLHHVHMYAGHVSSSVVWSAFSVCLSKAFYQLICLFGLLVLRNVVHTYTYNISWNII